MSHERKVDVSGIWGQRTSSDTEETKRAQRRAQTPLVSVNRVQGHVITINNATGLDLAALLAQPPRAEGGS